MVDFLAKWYVDYIQVFNNYTIKRHQFSLNLNEINLDYLNIH